jgi:hypothetical protein
VRELTAKGDIFVGKIDCKKITVIYRVESTWLEAFVGDG